MGTLSTPPIVTLLYFALLAQLACTEQRNVFELALSRRLGHWSPSLRAELSKGTVTSDLPHPNRAAAFSIVVVSDHRDLTETVLVGRRTPLPPAACYSSCGTPKTSNNSV